MTADVKSNIYTDFQGLAQLRHQAATDTPAAIKKVGQQFEAMFIQMMLKSMRDATPGDTLFGDKQTKLYRELFDKQISQDMAAKGTLGIADVIANQLQRDVRSHQSDTQSDSQGVSTSSSVDKGLGASKTAQYASPTAFVSDIWPSAQKAAKELGVDPQVLVAQAALETGWGQNVVSRGDGSSSNNFFGIKAKGDWQGTSVSAPTTEYRNGVISREQGKFRAYDSVAESFRDYVSFLKGRPQYQQALTQAGDPRQFLDALQQAGYATDPQYSQKIQSIIGGSTMAESISGLKRGGGDPIA